MLRVPVLGLHRYRHWSIGVKLRGAYVGSMSYSGPPEVCTRCGRGRRWRPGSLY